MKILVTGKSGQLGSRLARALAPLGSVTALGRDGMDLADPDAIRTVVDDVAPDIIFNAAAYTAVDDAETDRATAWRINADAPGEIGKAAARTGARVVHFSTDYVFDGTLDRPYRETDDVNPINVYGESKRAGEATLLASGANAWIFRISWVYAETGRNFLNTIMRLAKERTELNIVADQTGAPTPAGHIADAMAALTPKLITGDTPQGDGTPPIYHLACGGEASWYDFACAIVDRMQRSGCAMAVESIAPVGSDAYPTAAARPRNSRLDSGRCAARFAIALPAWQTALDDTMDRIEQNG
ncbi:MAG: dTDP-4-dehydrorhamnose reductase [Rhodospirillales bacterium]